MGNKQVKSQAVVDASDAKKDELIARLKQENQRLTQDNKGLVMQCSQLRAEVAHMDYEYECQHEELMRWKTKFWRQRIRPLSPAPRPSSS